MGVNEGEIMNEDIKLDPKYLPLAMLIDPPTAYLTGISPGDAEVRIACGVVDFLRTFNQVWRQIFKPDDIVRQNTSFFHKDITNIAIALLVSKGWHVSKELDVKTNKWNGFILVSPSPIPQPEEGKSNAEK